MDKKTTEQADWKHSDISDGPVVQNLKKNTTDSKNRLQKYLKVWKNLIFKLCLP